MSALTAWWDGEAPWSAQAYRVFRLCFGGYLLVHFVHLIPWAAELFSNEGMLPDASLSPISAALPNLLSLYDAPWFCVALLCVAAVLSGLLAVGKWDRVAAVGLWVIWAALFARNPLISNPGLPYVGLLLVVHAMIPSAGALWEQAKADWAMPKNLFVVVWILMALGYTYSGYTKLISPSWIDGTALTYVLEGPLGRGNGLSQLLLALPAPFMKVMTWGALGLELLFVPLALHRTTRGVAWAAMLAMHFGIIATVAFADLTLGMVVLHLFTFDRRWLRPLKAMFELPRRMRAQLTR